MKKTLIAVVLVGVAVLASPVFAENGDSNKSRLSDDSLKLRNNASTTASTTIRKATKLDQVSARLQERANKEIDRRITNLNKLEEKIQGISKLSSTEKASLVLTIQNQISLLSNLKIKINAETDAATLKTDVQSITKAYRIYALVLPQIEIIVAADKISTTANTLSDLSVKLQSRSKDVVAIQQLLADMNAKIADAQVKASAAIAGVKALVPDNGVKSIKDANDNAFKAARDSIKAGTKDLKDAKKIADKIRNSLKIGEKERSATSTATTTDR